MLSFANYILINMVLFFGFCALKIISMSFSLWFTQRQLLTLTRHNFIAIIAIFFVMPNVISIQPPLTSALPLPVAASSEIYNAIILLSSLFLGILIYACRYVFSFYKLIKLPHSLLLMKKINSIEIYLSETLSSPLCYSLLYKHIIIMPAHVLNNHIDFKLSLKHELQHIRNNDTQWLHVFNFFKIFFFWNPAFYLWTTWCKQLQEYACDEAVIAKNKLLVNDYAQCLLNTAKFKLTNPINAHTLSITNGTKKLLSRRIQMLFNYKPMKNKLTKMAVYTFSLLSIASGAYAAQQPLMPYLTQEMITKTMNVSVEPEVVHALNEFRNNPQKNVSLQQALQRFKEYQPQVAAQLKSKQVPLDFLAMPLIQSGYRPLEESKNPVHAAGIWQIIPTTAHNLGLVVNGQTDERLNTARATNAAATYLKALYAQFRSWKLAALAYEIGEKHTAQLIQTTGSRNAWQLARSYKLEPGLRRALISYLANFDAAVIVLQNPGIISPSAS